jgi:hypothetical protein
MLSLVPASSIWRSTRWALSILQRLHCSGRRRPARDGRAARIRSLQLIAVEALIADWVSECRVFAARALTRASSSRATHRGLSNQRQTRPREVVDDRQTGGETPKVHLY